MAKPPTKKEYPRSFRLDDQTKQDLERCAELSRSTDTEVLRQSLRLYRRKLEREQS